MLSGRYPRVHRVNRSRSPRHWPSRTTNITDRVTCLPTA